MSALSIQPTYPIFTDIDGQPLEAGYVWIGAANLDPQTNPINVYWDAALTISAPQPIRTLAGYPSRNGTPARLYVNSDYSIRVMNKNGSMVYSAPAATERYSDVVVSGVNAEDVIYDPPFIGGVQTNVEAKLAQTVSVKDFGAVGDDSDETTNLTNALTAAAGNTLSFEPGKVYRSTAALVVPPNTTLELNGSKIKFVITGSQNCLVPTDGVTVRNGSVELAGSGYTGHGGNGCPIIVGDYGLGTGHKNIKVENVTITSNKVGGNAFFITGDSENIVFENIEIPGPTVIANYGCHWGGANDPTAGTTHPHNIVMRNIKMGTSTHTTAIGAVTSGCYDVLMENLVFDNMPLHCVYIFCGDYGMEFATDANIKALGIHNIKVKNVTGKRVGYPVYIDMFKNVAPATPEKERCTSIMLENCSFFGNAPTDSTKFGFRLRYADNVVMQSCVFKNFYNAGRVTLSSNNNTFYNCEFSSSRLGGIFWTITGETSSTPSQRNTFENCLFKDNNQASSASISDIYLQWGGYNTIKDCKFDSPLIPWNVRTGTGATASFGNVVTGNLIVTPPTSVCFSFGSGTDYGIVTMFAGNRMANNTLVPVNGFAGGQLHLPFDTTPRAGQNRVASKYVGAAIPVANLWTVGDTVYYNAPAAGGKIGAVCVTEGTPGTWKEFGAIDA
jgi:hypothetical protein